MAYALEWDRRSRLHKYFLASTALHAVVSGGLLWWGWWEGRERVQFGDPNSLGGTPITPVSGIPVLSRGPQNPLANETESLIPRQPKPETKQEQKDDPEAVVFKGRQTAAKQRKLAAKQKFQPKAKSPSQIYSTTGAKASSEMFTAPGGAGGVGVGQGNPFGARFGWYADLIRQRVSQKWRTQDLDPGRADSAPVVILTFDIQRNGQVSNIRLLQRSGSYSLDVSAQRAVQEAAPLPPLPDGFDRNSATVEFHFQLKR